MKQLMAELEAYRPFNEQEARDQALILRCLQTQPDVFTRANLLAHMTASAWVVNPERTKALMAYHNLYGSWAWLGGHADGETDLRHAALREVREESGLSRLCLVRPDIFSVEVLTVDGHIKGGAYVSSHLHLNLTYLIEGDETEPLTVKPDENSRVAWFPLAEALRASTEPWFTQHIYGKLNEKLALL